MNKNWSALQNVNLDIYQYANSSFLNIIQDISFHNPGSSILLIIGEFQFHSYNFILFNFDNLSQNFQQLYFIWLYFYERKSAIFFIVIHCKYKNIFQNSNHEDLNITCFCPPNYGTVQVSEFIFFDQGVETSFTYGGTSWCKTAIPWEKQYQFSGTFANIPQIIITPLQYNVAYPTTVRQVYIQTEIAEVTTTSFIYKISCGIQDDIPKMDFKWYAFDEKKITVITSNMISNPVDGTIYTHSHTNSVANQGFVYVNSYRFEGSLNFHLELYQIAMYSVKVKIHNSSNNLSELGYTIVIGAPEFIQASELIDTGVLKQTPFTKYFQQINSAPTDAVLLVQIAGIQTDINAIRFQFFQSINPVRQISQITVQNWGDAINAGQIYWAWLFQAKQLPLICSKYRISKKHEPIDNHFTAFHLLELNLSYYDLNNNQQITITKDYNVINFVLEFVFPINKKLKVTLLRCNGCGPINYYQFEKKATSQQNKLTLYATFMETQSVEKYLILNISLTSLTIIQRINSAIMTTLVEVLIL